MATPIPKVRPWPLALGVTVLALAWLGPLPTLAATWFTAHMTMHVAVVAVAAPLLALATAGTLADPVPWAPRLFAPIPLSLLELAVVWTWHAPALHHLARSDTGWLALEQGMFLVSALLVWTAALGAPHGHRAPGGIIALLMTSMHMTFLGALLAIGPHDLFHAPGGTSGGPDQQAGGLIMLLVGGIAYMMGGLGLLAGLLRAAPDHPAADG